MPDPLHAEADPWSAAAIEALANALFTGGDAPAGSGAAAPPLLVADLGATGNALTPPTGAAPDPATVRAGATGPDWTTAVIERAWAQLAGEHPGLEGLATRLVDVPAPAGDRSPAPASFASVPAAFPDAGPDPVDLLGSPAPAAETGYAPVLTAAGQPAPVAPAHPAATGFDAAGYRRDFPILRERVHGRELVWLDNGATTQKPQQVIDRISRFYERENSNVHRTAHTLAARATDAYEGARDAVRGFLNARSSDEVVWVRGTTEGINLLANTLGEQQVGPGDEILLSHLEHHANIVPWQMLAQRKGATLRVAPVDDTGQIVVAEFERLLTARTKVVAFTHVSNALGTITPVRELTAIAHRHGATVIVDGAQAVPHLPVDVQALGVDFYVFSGHKMFAPTGIGVVWGRGELLADLPPWQGGGNMIDTVRFDRTTYQPPPWRFEAGTGSIADAVGLGAAVRYLERIGLTRIGAHEHQLLTHGTSRLSAIPGLRIIGTAEHKAAVLSFVIDGHEPEAIGRHLDQRGIAVRAGHHCAQPILRRFGVTGTVRAAFALYNTLGDVDRLAEALEELVGDPR